MHLQDIGISLSILWAMPILSIHMYDTIGLPSHARNPSSTTSPHTTGVIFVSIFIPVFLNRHIYIYNIYEICGDTCQQAKYVRCFNNDKNFNIHIQFFSVKNIFMLIDVQNCNLRKNNNKKKKFSLFG